eukprot:4600800-Ditylum_brightwellii.AAC.1
MDDINQAAGKVIVLCQLAVKGGADVDITMKIRHYVLVLCHEDKMLHALNHKSITCAQDTWAWSMHMT